MFLAADFPWELNRLLRKHNAMHPSEFQFKCILFGCDVYNQMESSMWLNANPGLFNKTIPFYIRVRLFKIFFVIK